MTIIGRNQAISRGVYSRTVADAARVPHDFLTAHAARVDLAYDMGEPPEMLAHELRLRFRLLPESRRRRYLRRGSF